MGYLSITNLYKEDRILLFKECYAMEKIHGTSTQLRFVPGATEIEFDSGGVPHERFVSWFDAPALLKYYQDHFTSEVIIYGEAYGGSIMRQSKRYGVAQKFIAFEVQIDGHWLSVPNAEDVVTKFGLEFVSYARIPTTIEAINAERDRDSEQAIRNGVGPGQIREGVVLRPIEEFTRNNGKRVISKHKREEFSELATPREYSPETLKLISDGKAVADEWVTEMRLEHVLDKTPVNNMKNVMLVINAMIADIYKESEGEVVPSKNVELAIGRKTAILFREYLKRQLEELDNE